MKSLPLPLASLRIVVNALWLVVLATLFGCKPAEKQRAAASGQAPATASTNAAFIAAQLQALREAGVPTTYEELNRYYVRPPGENPARLFAQAFALMTRLPTNAPKLDHRQARLVGTEGAMVAAKLRQNEAALAALQPALAAAAKTTVRYPIDFTRGYNMQMPHLVKVKTMASLLSYQAALATDADQDEIALRAIENSIGLARSLETEPVLISQIISGTTLILSSVSLERLLDRREVTEGQLAALAKLWSEAEAPGGLEGALVEERVMIISLFEVQPEQVPHELGLSPNDQGASNAVVRLRSRSSSAKEEDFGFVLAALERLIAASRRPFPASQNAAYQIQQELANRAGDSIIISKITLPALFRMAVRTANARARVRLAQAALAVERYRVAHEGKLPESLAAALPGGVPLDPHNGRPLRYKLQPKGYLLYSVGEDGKDNDGVDRRDVATGEPFDLPFTVER